MQRLDPSRFAAVPPRIARRHDQGTRDIASTMARRSRRHSSPRGAALPALRRPGSSREPIAPGRVSQLRRSMSQLGSAKVHATGAAGGAGDQHRVHASMRRRSPKSPRCSHPPCHGRWRAKCMRSGVVAMTGATLERRRRRGAADRCARVRMRRRRVQGHAIDRAAAAGSRGALGEPRADVRHRRDADSTLPGALGRRDARIGHRHARTPPCNARAARHRTSTRRSRSTDRCECRPAVAIAAGAACSTTFENRATVPVRLRAPATSRCAATTSALADAHVDAADGSADIGEFAWNDGRITTRGSFSGIARHESRALAGQALPVEVDAGRSVVTGRSPPRRD